MQYNDGEEVVLWMNTVGPYHNRQETYTYYSLPFCRGTKKEISHYHETLGEAIQGVELDFSGIDIAFRGIQTVCTCANNNIVTKILSRRENTTNRQGVEQLRVLFGSSFLYFPLKVVGGHVRSRGGGGSLAPAL